MRKYALLTDNVVNQIVEVSEDQLVSYANYLVIDVTDLLIQPQTGWELVGNTLQSPEGQEVALYDLINAKIKQYQESAPALLRDLYTTNTLLGITLEQSDTMFEEYSDVLLRIREGAWPTALYRISQKEPNGFVTQEMIDNWYALIQSRLA